MCVRAVYIYRPLYSILRAGAIPDPEFNTRPSPSTLYGHTRQPDTPTLWP